MIPVRVCLDPGSTLLRRMTNDLTVIDIFYFFVEQFLFPPLLQAKSPVKF